MKKMFGKLGAMLIAVLMIVGMFSTVALAAPDSLPDSTTSRILHLYKYTPVTAAPGLEENGTEQTIPAGYTALENVQFDVYKVPAAQTTSLTPSADEITAIAIAANLTTTLTTDANGHATYTFGNSPTADGIYLIVEKDNPAVTTKSAPFYLSVPLTNVAGDGYLYTMYVYPKNAITPAPTIDKDVREVGDDDQGYDMDEVFPYILRGGVPADLYDGKGTTDTADDVYATRYEFTDTLDSKLDYQGGIVVKLFTKAGGTELTVPTTGYTTTGTTATAGNPGGIVKVQLTQAGMKYIMDNLGAGTQTPEIRVYFNASINDSAVMGEKIENNAQLDYTGSTGFVYDQEEVPADDRPQVYTGGFQLLKVDSETNAAITAGAATFKIASSEANATAGNFLKRTAAGVIVDVGEAGYTDATSADITVTTSTANGIAEFKGLAYQDDAAATPANGQYYWLVETVAPTGYNLLTSPQRITINATSYAAASRISVVNTKKFTLPTTGGTGTILFTTGGIALVGVAVLLLILNKRKQTAK